MTTVTEREAPKSGPVPVWKAPQEASTRTRAHVRAREAVGPESPAQAPAPTVTVSDQQAGPAGVEQAELEVRDAGAGVWLRLRRQLAPPQPWTHRPASLEAMRRYAARGGWAGPHSPARRAMTWWFRLVALPVTVLAHYLAWTVERPARTVVVAVVWAVVMQLPPIYAAAAWLLPWDPWPIH